MTSVDPKANPRRRRRSLLARYTPGGRRRGADTGSSPGEGPRPLPLPGWEGLGASGAGAGPVPSPPVPVPRPHAAQPPHRANWNAWLGQTSPPTQAAAVTSHLPLGTCSLGLGRCRHTGSPECTGQPPPRNPLGPPQFLASCLLRTWGFLQLSCLLTLRALGLNWGWDSLECL